ncbi:MAG: pilus (MSHA type) biogenesis protein MshL [Desulfobulbaceae bacterium]|nr:pilus (MSHA type) biogenesis protein MshL [Desulfobulbaceae bacterium]
MKLSSKIRSQVTSFLAFFLVSLAVVACTPTANDSEKATIEAVKPEAISAAPVTKDMTPPSLPVQYQKPAYTIDSPSKDELSSQADEAVLKVGARINSTKKVALREIMKPLASQKRLNISWASDVNQDILVDVDIKANDDFYMAIGNILRQVDYFYELQGSTLVIKYRDTKQFQIAMPFTKQTMSVTTGGNALGGGQTDPSTMNNIEGTIKISSEKNEFDVWNNIKLNLDSILEIWTQRRENENVSKDAKEVDKSKIQDGSAVEGSRNFSKGNEGKAKTDIDSKGNNKENIDKQGTNSQQGQIAGGKGFYIIDKPVGLITVTAPRPLVEKVEAYLTSLQKEIYKQISIEAKIIEVQLLDSSSIGVNWNQVLSGFKIDGSVAFGDEGSIFHWDPTTGTTNSRVVSDVSINTADFTLFLNALKTQGNTKVLSNPKISVLNGQPAMISVGRNVTYLKEVSSEVTGTGADRTTNYTATPGTILSGVGLGLTATILNNNEIILNLVPVTSELLEGTEEAVVVAGAGETEVKMGLPIVNVREMSTTVRVKNGDMLVIGGLISDMNDDQANFAPVLGDIPLVKYLFGYEEKVKNKRELIILLKPRII